MPKSQLRLSMSLPPCFILVGRMSPVVIRPSLSPKDVVWIGFVGKIHRTTCFLPLRSPEYTGFRQVPLNTSGKPRCQEKSNELGSHLGNQGILWMFNEMSTVWSWSCFRDSPGTPGMWSQTRKWVKTHGKTICFFGHQTLKHSVLENHRLFVGLLEHGDVVCA